MINKIYDNKKLIALVLRSKFSCSGIKFLTPNNFSQQLGYMKRPKNYQVKPHKHKRNKRSVNFTNEVLYVKKGKVLFNLFNKKDIFIKKIILNKGDFILIGECGHSLKMLENSELIEVKQGPYLDDDKVMIKTK